MKKNQLSRSFYIRKLLKPLLIMKLCFILILVFSITVTAKTYSQKKKVNLSISNGNILEVLNSVKKQTGFEFFYNENNFSSLNKITINEENIYVKDVLSRLFDNTDLTFEMRDNIILIVKKKKIKLKAQQQDVVTISGVVKDEKGIPLPGVSVLIKGTSNGVSTDNNGRFFMKFKNLKKTILIFSFIGMKKQVIEYKGKELTVILKEDTKNLQTINVVSIGYGELKREKVSSAITSITAKELNDSPALSLSSLLQGKIAGLNIINSSGAPGVRNEVYVRGVGIVGNDRNAAPLYVIDGIPIEPMEDPTMLSRSTNTDPLAGMNPNDIESVDILKDASAAAIYGSRGANGVIIVKTKMGIKDRPRINYSSNFIINMIPQLQETVGGKKERALKKQIWENTKGGLDISLSDYLNPFYNNSTNWQDLYYRTALSHEHNLSISGGNKGVVYRVAFGYRKDQGIMIGSDFERYTVNSSTKYSPFKKMFINFNIQMSRTDRSRPNGDNNALNTKTGIGLNFPSSLIAPYNNASMQKLQDAYKMVNSVNIVDNIRPALNFDFAFIKNLRIRSSFSINYSNSKRTTFKPSALNGIDPKTKRLNGSSFNSSLNTGQTYLTENTISYLNTFKDAHTLNALVGYSQTFNERNNNYVNATKGISDAIQDLNGYTKENTTSSTRYNANSMQSFFTRLQYDYKSKYIIALSMRADGSSRFGENNKFGYFPSASVAYNIHREAFLKQLEWINKCKIRWSWGINGNQFGNDYLAQGIYTLKRTGTFGGSDYQLNTYNGTAAILPSYRDGIVNKDLTWEESEQYNLGFDFSLFKYRISASFDAFWKKSSGILFNYKLPDISGYEKAFKNATEVVNYGYEFSLTGQLFKPTNDFTWRMRLNGAITRNYITKLPNNNADLIKYNYGGLQLLRVGRPANGYFTYMSDGIYATDQDVPINPYTGKRLSMGNKPFQAGDYIIKDLDGSGHIYEVSSSSGGYLTTDRGFSGNPYPKFTGGFMNTIRYKNLALDLNFNFVYGRKILNQTIPQKMSQILQSQNSNMYDYTQYNHWKKPGDNADYPVLNPDRFKEMPGLYNYRNTVLDSYIEDASYIKLSNVRLSYSFDKEKLRKYKFRSLALFVSLTNVFTITSYSGADPENVSMFGVDSGQQYARPRTCNVGINLEF